MNDDEKGLGVITVFREGQGWGFIQSRGHRLFFHKSMCKNGPRSFNHLRNGLSVEFVVKTDKDGKLQAHDVNRIHCRVEFIEPLSFVITAEPEPVFGNTFGRCPVRLRNDESPKAAHDALESLGKSMGFNGVVNRRYTQYLDTDEHGAPRKYWVINGDFTVVMIPYPESQSTLTRDMINVRLTNAEIEHAYYQAQQPEEIDSETCR